MKQIKWQVFLSLGLIGLSVLFYFLHFLLFHDSHHIFIYLIGDIAFVFIEVLMVTIILHQLLSLHEKKVRMEKLNMVIGAFFSELGISLLTLFSNHDNEIASLKEELLVRNNWDDKKFTQSSKSIKKYRFAVDSKTVDLPAIRALLREKRDFLLRLLENPNLLEHEDFTDLLWAVFHLTEELIYRRDLSALSDKDSEHISIDIKRAYRALTVAWIHYMNHLKNQYPYLFSLALRTNPFDEQATPELQ